MYAFEILNKNWKHCQALKNNQLLTAFLGFLYVDVVFIEFEDVVGPF